MSYKWFTGAMCAFGLILATGCVINLQPSDKISTKGGLFITTMGLIFFSSLAEFLNESFLNTRQGQYIQKKYHLMLSDVLEINNKLVSAIQAMLSSTAGFIVCQHSCRLSFLRASHFMSDAYAWFGAAYFLYDIWWMFKVYTQKLKDHEHSNSLENIKEKLLDSNDGNHQTNQNCLIENFTKKPIEISFIQFCRSHPVMLIHHTFLASFGLIVIVYLRRDFGDCVYSFIYLMEISTPFVSVRSILSILHLKKSTVYVINGLLMLISFFICRILMWPMVYWWYSRIIQTNIFEAVFALPLSCKLGTLVLFLPQVYWFYLMLKGALKILIVDSTKRKL